MSSGSSKSKSVPKGLDKLSLLDVGVSRVELSDIDLVYSSVEKMGKNFGRYVADQLNRDQFTEDDVIRIYSHCKKQFINMYSVLIFENLNKLESRRERNKALHNLKKMSSVYVHLEL